MPLTKIHFVTPSFFQVCAVLAAVTEVMITIFFLSVKMGECLGCGHCFVFLGNLTSSSHSSFLCLHCRTVGAQYELVTSKFNAGR